MFVSGKYKCTDTPALSALDNMEYWSKTRNEISSDKCY